MDAQRIDFEILEEARRALLATALDHFQADPDVVAVFLGGSIAGGSADAWSDIDLRVVAKPEHHASFVERRLEIPKAWPGFLFNEWVPTAQHCVSHFRPFGKIDIFYYSAAALSPSPWYRLPIKILHDPEGFVADLVDRSKSLSFTIEIDDVDFSISKGLAAAHETYRRAMRGELFFAQTLLDEMRQHIMQADDWLNGRTPESAAVAKFEQRASAKVNAALRGSYRPCVAVEILDALRSLVALYREQITQLHSKFRLTRSAGHDLEALDAISFDPLQPETTS